MKNFHGFQLQVLASLFKEKRSLCKRKRDPFSCRKVHFGTKRLVFIFGDIFMPSKILGHSQGLWSHSVKISFLLWGKAKAMILPPVLDSMEQQVEPENPTLPLQGPT